MDIWDTPGGDHLTSINASDYNNADAVVLVYAINMESSFESLQDMHERIKSINPKCLFFLVGNKSDLDGQGFRQISKADGPELCEELEMESFVETTAFNYH